MAALVAAGLAGIPIFAAVCLPTLSTGPIDVNGIVVTTDGTPPTPCTGDQGWGGVAHTPFTQSGDGPTDHVTRLYLSADNVNADNTLDHVYIGVHVEKDPELREADRVLLFVDANGNGGNWDSSDFAVLFEIGIMTPPSTQDCRQSPGNVFFHRYNTTTSQFDQQPSVPAGIVSRVSWDYETALDDESEIWELEVALDVAALGLTAPASGTGVRLGARLYINEVGMAGMPSVWRWPAGLTTSTLPSTNPNSGSIQASNLEQPEIGQCGLDVQLTEITATNAGGESNKFTRYTNSNFNSNGTLDESKQNHFTAKLRFVNPQNLSDMSMIAAPNNGNVRFVIRPYNAGFLGEYLMGSIPVTFTQLGQEVPVHLDWPKTKAQYDDPTTHQPKTHLNQSDHSCLKISVAGFNLNADPDNDAMHRNLTYTALSTIKDRFLISADGPGIEPTGPVEYLLHAKWSNVNPADVSPPNRPVRGKWSYLFPTAQKIGLKDLGNGYFSLQLKPAEERWIDIAISGGRMRNAQPLRVPARAGGTVMPRPSGLRPVDVPVTPYTLVTVVAHGTVNMPPRLFSTRVNGPNGFTDSERRPLDLLLSRSGAAYLSWANIGALIGSFDGFRTAFVIGTDSTFIVPTNAKVLSLAVNGVEGTFDEHRGRGFEANVFVSGRLALPTRLANIGNAKLGTPTRLRAGVNLPELSINAFRVNRAQQVALGSGYVAWGVYASHP